MAVKHLLNGIRQIPLVPLTTLIALVALVGGCQGRLPWEQSDQQRRSQVALLRCQQDQAAVVAQVGAIRGLQGKLKQLQAESFVPPVKPSPMDPELAQRYTQEDRDLDEERYQRSLRDWEQLHAERYHLWLRDHTQRERRLELNIQQKAHQLRLLNGALLKSDPSQPGALRLQSRAVETYSRCNPEAF